MPMDSEWGADESWWILSADELWSSGDREDWVVVSAVRERVARI